MSGRTKRWVVSLALIALLASGCSTNHSSSATEEVPVSGGTFRQGLVKLASDDPALAKTVSERIYADHLYDGLTGWNPRSLEPKPALAERWEPSADLKQWTFHLRNSAAANGDEITATDVKSTFQHIARKSVGSPGGELLAAVSGYNDFSVNEATTDLAGVVVIDPKTVRIELDRPMAELPIVLASPNFGIVHKAPDGSSVTTGPFAIGARENERVLDLVKVKESKAYLDKVRVSFYDSVEDAYADLDSGNLDWSLVPQGKISDAVSRFGRHLFEPSLRTLYLSFNLANPKYADVRFREAIVRAIDRATVVSKFSLTDVTSINGIVSTGLPDISTNECGERCRYDVEAAKSLLAQVFPGATPPPVVIDIPTGAPFTDEATKVIVDNLAAVGIPATVRPSPADQFGNVTVMPDREIFQTGWSAAYPSPGAFLAPLFDSVSPSNVSALKDPKIDEALRKAEGEIDQSTRRSAWRDAEVKVLEQIPVVPLAQFPVNSAALPAVRGVAPLPTGNFDIASVWIERS